MPVAILPDQVPEPVKLERLHRLQALLERQQAAFNAGCVGRVLPVLFEREGRHAGQLVGRSPYLQPVHAAAAPAVAGRIAPVMIDGAGPNSLSGSLLPAA
jgi:tRNA-2-methylthio-N6-dimethylallyladenosine synthase